MRSLIFTFFILIWSLTLSSQTFEMKTDNFRQLDETTIQWELWIKKASGPDFGLYTWQLQWTWNNEILNGGGFTEANFTISPGADAVFMGHYNNADAVVPGPGQYFSYTPSSFPNTGEFMTLVTEDWKHIATYTAQLTLAGSLHNFGSADPQFAHRLGGIVEVFAADNPYAGPGTQSQITGTLTTAPGVPVNDRQLAGYWFTGEGDWNDALKWNQTLKAATPSYVQTTPGPNANVVINGNSTLQGGDDISLLPDVNGSGGELTVLTGEEPLYSFTLSVNGIFRNVAVIYDDDELTVLAETDGASDPVNLNLPAGKIIYLETYRIGSVAQGGSFINWTGDVNLIPGFDILEEYQQVIMPAANVSLISNWTTGTKSDPIIKDFRNSLFASLTISPLATLTVDKLFNDHEQGAAAIVVKSSAAGTGSLIHNSSDVPATIERYISGPGYHLVSVPFTQAANPVSGWFLWSYLYEFVPGTGWQALGAPTSTPLNVDQGYMVYKYQGPEEWSADTTYSMAGPMNNGLFAANVTGVEGNHNLVPNPYPSAIDWTAISGWTKTNLYDAIWIWNPVSGNYAAFGSQAGINGATKDIPVGQAFFVQASGPAPALAMTNDVRVHSTQPFFKEGKEVENLLRIKARANNYSDEIIVRFREGSTNNFDGQYDAAKMFGLEDAPQLYSMAADDVKLSINSVPFQMDALEIPVGFQTDFNGEVTFEFSSVDSFDPEISIYLIDQLAGITTDLRTAAQYVFNHNQENDPLRFKLSFNDATSVHERDMFNIQAYFFSQRLNIYIPGEISRTSQVNLYNASGQLIYSGNVEPGRTVLSVSGLPQGVYMIQVVNDKQTVVRKALYN